MTTRRALSPPRLPDFIIIGAQKSATRWLRDSLATHPEVFVHESEMEFFTHKFDKGLDWYRHELQAPQTVEAVGEATPGYMMWTNDPDRVAARIDGSLPGARLVALLRDPIDRLVSAYIHHARMGRLEGSTSLIQELENRDPERDELGLVSGGWYGRSLKSYAERFGKRLLVELHEDVRDNPQSLFSRVCRHIRVTDSWTPPGLGEVAHSNRDQVSDQVLEGTRLEPDQRTEIWDKFFAEDVKFLRSLVAVDTSAWESNNL